MNKLLFIYIVICYLIASVFTLENTITIQNQLLGSSILVIIFGIPHGAIDNILFLTESNLSKKVFYLLYFLSMLLYCFLWFISPLYSFIFFLFMSAYHFGESQLSNYNIEINFSKFIFLIWGVALISTLFLYNAEELSNLFNSYDDTSNFSIIFKYNVLDFLFYSSNFVIVLSLLYLKINKLITNEIFSTELFQIILLHITFFIFPVIISFTLYFVFLHSIKVLLQEYSYLEQKISGLNLMKFIKLLAPFTLLSLFFFIIFILISNIYNIDISLLLFLIISISVITLPHSISMTSFYDKINFK
jgi:beta-carotene 15,15'-dioxygenase